MATLAFSITGAYALRSRDVARRRVCVASANGHSVRVVHHNARAYDHGDRQPVVFLSGLNSVPLPQAQVNELQQRFRVVSICHRSPDRSEWDQLAQEVADIVRAEAESHVCRSAINEETDTGVVLVGESFGAALALRVAALCTGQPRMVKKLVLINSGTALQNDPPLQQFTALLPLLKLDPTAKILYRAAAILLYRLFLVDEGRLDPSNIRNPEDTTGRSLDSIRAWFTRSVDINAVPLDAMLHRVNLLRTFHDSFSDDCIRRLINVPTILVASKRDKLLRSEQEAKRLATLLPEVERTVLLKDSAHACLLEGEVSLYNMLCDAISTRSGSETAVDAQFPPDSVLVANTGPAVGNSEKRAHRDGNSDADAYRDAIAFGRRVLGPWRALTSPVFIARRFALEAIRMRRESGRPLLFVGNHGVYGLLDMPLLIDELNKLMDGERLRSLAHQSHFSQFNDISGGRWGPFCTAMGAVQASPRNFYRLLKNGEPILLFPGGPYEVCRRRGQKNKIHWREDTDFVRPAARMDAIIVPFSSLGADDCVDILLDGQELQRLPVLGTIFTQALRNNNFDTKHVMPLGTPPRPRQMEFEFHAPIDTAGIDADDTRACTAIYEQIRATVQNGIYRLQSRSTNDSNSLRVPGIGFFHGDIGRAFSRIADVFDDMAF